MSLMPGHIRNFETLKRAAKNGDLALVECKDAETGEYRAVICAVDVDDAKQVRMVPFGHLCNGNPYEEYISPVDSAEMDQKGDH